MSFFGGSYPFATNPSGTGFGRRPPQPANHPHGHPLALGYNGFYGHPTPASPFAHFATPYGVHHDQDYPQTYGHPGGDIDAEEQAALAHLEEIRRRREAATAHAAREAELRAERELAFQTAIQRERDARQRALEAAAERQREQQREREGAIRRTIAAQRERQQEAQRRQVQQAQQGRAAAIQQFKNRAIEVAKAKAYAYAQAAAQEAARRAALAAQQQQRYRTERAAQSVHTARCAGPCARSAEDNEDEKEKENGGDDGLEVLNSLFGPLFGFQLARDVTGNAEPTTKPKPNEKVNVPVASTTAPSKPKSTSAPVPVTEKKAEQPKSTEKKVEEPKSSELPAEINDLLSHFLGVRVGPAGEGETATNGGFNKDVIGGLNQLLGQFGLEFEPSTPDEVPTSTQSAAASSSSAPPQTAPAAAKQPIVEQSAKETTHHGTPIADFLNTQYSIPPFVRDILSNVEVALTQGQDFNPNPEPVVQGKGKAVADDEKRARSAPVVAPTPVVPESNTPVPAPSEDSVSSTASIDKLNNISHELVLATESFNFPDHLAFAEFSAADVPPPLLFNKTNSPYHAQTHKLLQLLLAADGISTGGDKDVRRKRKEVVSAVEGALEELEKNRDSLWAGVKEKRENGEETEHEESTSSGSSTTSDIEHIEEAEGTAYDASDAVEVTHAEFAEQVTSDISTVKVTPAELSEDNKVDEVQENADDEVVFDADGDEVPVDEVKESDKVEGEKKDVEDKEEKPAATGASTPRSVTIEDQEEGYEVL